MTYRTRPLAPADTEMPALIVAPSTTCRSKIIITMARRQKTIFFAVLLGALLVIYVIVPALHDLNTMSK